jgi:hypothetical protein
MNGLSLVASFVGGLSLLGCSAGTEPKAAPQSFIVCSTNDEFFETGAMVREFASHGIKCERGGGSHFMSTGVAVRGSLEDVFRARDIILKNVQERKWSVSWPADSIILPDDPRADKRKVLTPKTLVRLANVQFKSTPTFRLMELLKRQGIEAELFLGAAIDVLAVHQSDFERAAGLLKREAFPGVELPGASR